MSQQLQNTIDIYTNYIKTKYDSIYSKDYWILDTNGTYIYIFNNKNSIKKIAQRINGDSFKRKIGYASLKYSSKINTKLLKYIPNIKKITIKTPIENPLEYAIIGPKGVFMLNEYVFITAEEKIIRKEIKNLEKIPNKINHPQIKEKNKNYYTQDFLKGREAQPINKKTDIIKGLNELKIIYQQKNKTILIEDVIYSIKKSNEISKYFNKQKLNKIIQKAIDYGLPESINKSYIHGDLHSQNILITDNGEPYIIDWSDYRFDYSILDLYLSYQMSYSKNTKYYKNPFKQLINNKGIYHKRHKEIAKTIGEEMYNNTDIYNGLPIIYLLLTIHCSPVEYYKRTANNILNDILF